VTVKRFKREGSKVWLIAENPEFAPIEVDLKDQELVIEGLMSASFAAKGGFMQFPHTPSKHNCLYSKRFWRNRWRRS
jgi:hypothetical protein